MNLKKWIKLFFNLILGIYTIFIISLNLIVQPANSQIDPNSYQSNPLNLDTENIDQYGWCLTSLEVEFNNKIFNCNIAKAFPVPTKQDIDIIKNEIRTWDVALNSDPYSANYSDICGNSYGPTKIDNNVATCIETKFKIDVKKIDTPSDYLKRICYSRAWGGYKSPLYGLDQKRLSSDIGYVTEDIPSVIGGAIV